MKKARGVISAGDQLTAEVGAEVLRAGGNAFDACISATFMSFAASSSITSAGGGGFLLAKPAASKAVVYDFFVQTPMAKRPVDELDFRSVIVDFGDKSQEFHVGMGSVATPGNIAGLFDVHKQLGSIPITEIMAPVLDRIRAGIKLHKQTKYQVDILTPILTSTDSGRDIYCKDGRSLALGEMVYLPQMADTFDYLSRTGPREFYEGEIAQKIAAMAAEGGCISLRDMKEYQVIRRQPLKFNYRNQQILTNTPPNSGGPLIAFLLNLLEKVALQRGDYGSSKHLQALADAIRLTDMARMETGLAKADEAQWLSQLFETDFLQTMQNTLMSGLHKSGNTTHVSVADDRGNVASCTTSVGEGCGFLIPGTDIMLNNMLGEEDLNKGGFHQWKTNHRMSSMMSPTVVMGTDGSLMGLGSGGSNRIRSAIAQAIVNYIDFQLPYDEIVNAPRIHVENGHMDIEPGFSDDALHGLAMPKEISQFRWNEKNMYFGGVHAVFRDSKGMLHGAGDARRAGHVIKV
jgi:gamma-glutamyltranspeptidase/glutathione hydrolase